MWIVPYEKPLLLASYKVAYLCAKEKVIAETLVKPCAMEMVKTVLGKEVQNSALYFEFSLLGECVHTFE